MDNSVTPSYYFRMLLLHIAIAFAIYNFRPISVLLAHGIILYFLFIIIQNQNRNNEALMAAAYICGAEVFFRMTDGLIFYETGKYMMIIFLIIGMFFKGTSSKTVPYWTYLLILIPGIIVASITINYNADFRKLIAFNLSGPVTVGVSALYCYYKKIKKSDLEKVLLMLILPLIAQAIYLYLYTPTIREDIISLSGNYSATGGFGPNQISSVFGLGCFIIATRLFTVKNKWINFVDLILLILIGYRALISFSRGGVFTAIISIITFLIVFYYKQPPVKKSATKIKFIILGLSFLIIWIFSSVQTFGLIGNRYRSEDRLGQSKSDITTGRVELIETELQGFYENPITGIGVGKGREYREENLGIEINTHNEVSRLLSEHGLLGVLALLILIFVPIVFWTKFENNYYFLAFMAFWFLTINHSAMRIALPGFIYGLALLYIVDEKKDPVYRKRLSN